VAATRQVEQAAQNLTAMGTEFAALVGQVTRGWHGQGPTRQAADGHVPRRARGARAHAEHDLLALEKEPEGSGRAERFQTLFRTVHSLKGAARSVSIVPIVEACHRLEELLLAAQDGQAPPGPDLFALLFETADAIEEAGMRLREQPQDLGGSLLVALLPRLDAAVAKGAAVPAPPAGRQR
jgi:chemotaxis protein histidine kinase CheA